MTAERKVKGSVVQDMVKVVRAFRSEPWEQFLSPDDLKTVDSMVLPTEWYPVGFYQRVGLAVYKLVAKENEEAVKGFGRAHMQEMMQGPYRRFLLCGDPFAAVQKFLDLRRGLFNFSTMNMEKTGECSLTVRITDIGRVDQGSDLFNTLMSVQLQMIVENNGGQDVTIVQKELEGPDGVSLEARVAWQPDASS